MFQQNLPLTPPTKLARRRRRFKLAGAPPPPGKKGRPAAASNWSARTSTTEGCGGENVDPWSGWLNYVTIGYHFIPRRRRLLAF